MVSVSGGIRVIEAVNVTFGIWYKVPGWGEVTGAVLVGAVVVPVAFLVGVPVVVVGLVVVAGGVSAGASAKAADAFTFLWLADGNLAVPGLLAGSVTR